METITLFEMISKSIETIGIGYTIAGLIIAIGGGWIIKNERKSKKILAETVDTQNQSVLHAIEQQNIYMYEMARTSNNTLEAIKENSGKIDGFMTLVVGLVQRDVNKGGE